ncbi:MAG: hypothetical protein WC333_02345 [Dehalococcoidia bacterium]|jgi:predicted small secreted protein
MKNYKKESILAAVQFLKAVHKHVVETSTLSTNIEIADSPGETIRVSMYRHFKMPIQPNIDIFERMRVVKFVISPIGDVTAIWIGKEPDEVMAYKFLNVAYQSMYKGGLKHVRVPNNQRAEFMLKGIMGNDWRKAESNTTIEKEKISDEITTKGKKKLAQIVKDVEQFIQVEKTATDEIPATAPVETLSLVTINEKLDALTAQQKESRLAQIEIEANLHGVIELLSNSTDKRKKNLLTFKDMMLNFQNAQKLQVDKLTELETAIVKLTSLKKKDLLLEIAEKYRSGELSMEGE